MDVKIRFCFQEKDAFQPWGRQVKPVAIFVASLRDAVTVAQGFSPPATVAPTLKSAHQEIKKRVHIYWGVQQQLKNSPPNRYAPSRKRCLTEFA